MKKIIMMSGLLFVAFVSKAATISHVKEKENEIASYQISKVEIKKQKDPAVQCTVSLKGSLFLGFLAVEVTCSGTGTTCQQATEKAAACLQESIKAVKQLLD